MSDLPETGPAQPAPAAASVRDPRIRAGIDKWFNTHIADSAVARTVDAYNHLRSVLDHLEAEIGIAIQKEI